MSMRDRYFLPITKDRGVWNRAACIREIASYGSQVTQICSVNEYLYRKGGLQSMVPFSYVAFHQ